MCDPLVDLLGSSFYLSLFVGAARKAEEEDEKGNDDATTAPSFLTGMAGRRLFPHSSRRSHRRVHVGAAISGVAFLDLDGVRPSLAGKLMKRGGFLIACRAIQRRPRPAENEASK